MTNKAPGGIRIRDLEIRYKNGPLIRVPKLDLAPGTYTLITGPVGCGKSSLALALAGLLEEMTGATLTGEVRVTGRDHVSTNMGTSTDVSAVWQSPETQLFRSTVLDEVRVGLDFQLVPTEEGDNRARKSLRLVGLGHVDERRDPITLSGGEQQRLALASALVLETPILILDEAASQLDSEASSLLKTVIAEARSRRGITIVAFDHRPDLHTQEADRVIVLGDTGTILLDGTPEEVYTLHLAMCREIGVRVPGTTVAHASRPRNHPPSKLVPRLSAHALTARPARGELRDVPLFREVSFDLPAGSTALVVGPNGSGKSTLLHAIADMQPRITGFLRPEARIRRKHGIGYAPQRGGELLFTRTVREELRSALPASRSRDTPATVVDLEPLLERAGLLPLADVHPQRLSGGQRQRLATLVATARNPALVLLDEPTNAQDPAGIGFILGMILHRAEERINVIATHEETLFGGIATHRIEMQDGWLREIREL